MSALFRSALKQSLLVCLLICLDTQSYAENTDPKEHTSDAIHSSIKRDSSGREYVSGQILVRYGFKDSTGEPKRGRSFGERQEQVVQTIIARYGLKVSSQHKETFRPVFSSLVEGMIRQEESEAEFTARRFRTLAERKKPLNPSRAKVLTRSAESAVDRGFARCVVVYTNAEDTLSTIERLNDPIPLRGTNIVIESVSAVRLGRGNGNALGDPLLPDQWALTAIDAPSAWAEFEPGDGAVIAVVDSGVDAEHPDLVHQIWQNPDEIAGNNDDDDHNGFVDDVAGWDFVYDVRSMNCVTEDDCFGRDNDPSDGHGHGTHVSGIAAAQHGNGIGIAGVCPSCQIMPIRTMYRTEIGSTRFMSTDYFEALWYAIMNGADVINLSLGSDSFETYHANILQAAEDAGIVVVGAAGNDASNSFVWPAGLPTVIAVAGLDEQGRRAAWSDFGTWIDVGAPGQDTLSTEPGGQYGTRWGCSFAAPHVSGLAGWLLSLRKALSPAEVRQIIRETGVPIEDPEGVFDEDFRQINVYNALSSIGEQAPAWQNPDNNLDVSGDGLVQPIDALLVINYLIQTPNGPVPEMPPHIYADVSGDNVISPIDALMVINSLMEPTISPLGDKAVAEGESLSFEVEASDPYGNPILYSADNLPIGAELDAETGTFSWTPARGKAGRTSTVSLKAYDELLPERKVFEEIDITVLPSSTPGKIPIKNASASSELSDLYPATNVLDSDSKTFWVGANGERPWILELDFGMSYYVDALEIDFHSFYDSPDFELKVSDDGASYKSVFRGDVYSKTTSSYISTKAIELKRMKARYMQIVFHQERHYFPVVSSIRAHGWVGPAPRITGTMPLASSSYAIPPSMGSVGPENVIDRDSDTYWVSLPDAAPWWLSLSLPERHNLDSLEIHWYRPWVAPSFEIQISDDYTQWQTLQQVTTSNEEVTKVDLSGSSARFVRFISSEGPVGLTPMLAVREMSLRGWRQR